MKYKEIEDRPSQMAMLEHYHVVTMIVDFVGDHLVDQEGEIKEVKWYNIRTLLAIASLLYRIIRFIAKI